VSKKVCSGCGMQVGQTLRFCPSCGSENFGGQSPSQSLSGAIRAPSFHTQAQAPSSSSAPPTTPFNSAMNVAVPSTNVHAWRRYFARTFDGIIYIILVSYAFVMAFPEQATYLSSQHVDKAMGFLYYVAFMPVEAFCFYAFGTTLGKALYGIKVIKAGHSLATFGGSFERCFNIWVFGLGLGIPIIAFFTTISAYYKLKHSGSTSWDAKLGWQVTHSRLGAFRWIGIIASWVALMSVLVALEALAKM